MKKSEKKRQNARDTFTILNGRPRRIRLHMEVSGKKGIFDRSLLSKLEGLKKIYAKIPETECNKCGACCYCYIITPVFSIEYLNIFKYISGHFSASEIYDLRAESKINLYKIRQSEKKRIKHKQWEKWLPCIFLDRKKGLCRIHDLKPLVCRLGGLHFKRAAVDDKVYELDELCGNVICIDKKDEKRLQQNTKQGLIREVSALSGKYLGLYDDKGYLPFTKERSIYRWFLGRD